VIRQVLLQQLPASQPMSLAPFGTAVPAGRQRMHRPVASSQRETAG
jgi:hypothetical protein